MTLSDDQRVLLEDKFILWERDSRAGTTEFRDYHRRAADALRTALALASETMSAQARAETAERRLAEVEGERDEAREEALDARSTLAAWFELAEQAEVHLTPIILDGLKGYLHTSKNGGMPTKDADAAYAVLEDYCRKYLGQAVVPVLRTIQSAETARMREALEQAYAHLDTVQSLMMASGVWRDEAGGMTDAALWIVTAMGEIRAATLTKEVGDGK